MEFARLSARLDQLEAKLQSLTKAYTHQKNLIQRLEKENKILKQTAGCHTTLSKTQKQNIQHYISALERGIAYLEELES